MRDRGSNFKARWEAGSSFRRAAGLAGGFASTVLFALYNGVLGLWHGSLWHGSICAYYLLLSGLRGLLLFAERGGKNNPLRRRSIFYLSSVMLLVMNAALAVPVSLMVLDRRPVRAGLIPAIASAAYTTYKISAACVKLKRTETSVFLRELALLRFLDALVSILVLQNTLITAVDGQITPRMFRLVSVTSAGFLLVILVLSILWLVRGGREKPRG